ncbi:Ribosomal protein L22, bacterial-type [Candidatus Omnitrophus magneticus]|uniref:50S ribosomal protein L22 n=1 Tax=Candidatus Omnitrophus magneticus TaxID=1609969 RepID=A0A0F0CQP6_9BACT|nr:Ribosomal protein L22, bacterial-type [Candidatus Omnitrophus magneticus]
MRISTRKVRLVLDLIKGKNVEKANYILDTVNKRAGEVIKKVLQAAFANVNFERQQKLTEKDVIVSLAKADGGPMLKRFRAGTMGRAFPIRHRTTHIIVELDNNSK